MHLWCRRPPEASSPGYILILKALLLLLFSVKVFSLKNHCGCKRTHIIQPHTTIHLVIARIITGGNVAYIFLLGKMRRLKFSSNHFCHLSWLFSNTSSFLCCPQYYKWIEWRTLTIPFKNLSFCWFIILLNYSKVQKSLHSPLNYHCLNIRGKKVKTINYFAPKCIMNW